MSVGFIHLRLHSEYSLSDSVVRIPELVAAVADAGMPAVAVTDQNNLFAMVKFYREALQRGACARHRSQESIQESRVGTARHVTVATVTS